MNRLEFLHAASQGACAAGVALVCGCGSAACAEPSGPITPVDEALRRAREESRFVNDWLADLFAAMDAELDRPTQLKLMEGCGRGCFRRHRFKTEIAAAGQGDVARLLEAYRRHFLIEREGDRVHITYGRERNSCFCPAARNRPALPHDLHCECTRATHEAIFEAALGRHVPVELVETVRRGGQRCHLVAHLA